MDTRGSGPITEETVYKRGGEEKKNEKICFQADNQAKNKRFKHWGHSNPLWILGGAGQLENLLPDKEQSSRQTDGSKTEATLILCGYSGERANNRGDSTTERRMRRRKMRKFASKQTKNNQASKRFKHWDHSNPLWILEGAGQLENLLPKNNQTIKRFKHWDHSNPLWILEGAGQ